jgi:hypothetical protein
MFRYLIISLVICVPLAAFAAGTDQASPSSVMTIVLQTITVAMQSYLTSKLPPIEKRLESVERRMASLVNGVQI